MTELDDQTHENRQQRQRLTVVVAFEPELPEVELSELEDELVDLLLGMAVKQRGGNDAVQSVSASDEN